MGYRDNIEDFLNVMTSKTFIKNAIVDKGTKTLFIYYYSSFEEYIELNPFSKVVKEQYIDYFGTGDKIEKIVVLEPARILRDFKDIEKVCINLNYQGVFYEAEVDRDKLNDLIGFNISDLSPDNDSWRVRFSDVYGYGIENNQRRILFNHFIKINNNI
ncbi:hypothetical protein KM915_21090 [Cytobacillus oceanisediminis]|uniref:hypothetical protein n=1 Tax=Cytobacillus oceanisediminis TaxID=665099 RepID=UPI001C219BB4|nr:hypothetical protein [Cytobacillus oceanisediminis]MBU8732548.1 hypothetical protein [Cytobacillus oceanisediminis]